MDDKTLARFWSKVDKRGPNECWPWRAGPKHNRYGLFFMNGKNHGAHCCAWEFEHGTIPAGLFVCHNCPGGDNPRCCNPAHLWLGSAKQNSRDMVLKGRSASGDRHPMRVHPELVRRGDKHHARLNPQCMPRGERHGSRTKPDAIPRGDRHWARRHPEATARGERCGLAKLTSEQVLQIRQERARGVPGVSLALRFGVTPAAVSAIVCRKTWKHI